MATRLCFAIVAAILLCTETADACGLVTRTSHTWRINGTVTCTIYFQSSTTFFNSCSGRCTSNVKHRPAVESGSDVSAIPDTDAVANGEGRTTCCVGLGIATYNGADGYFTGACSGNSNHDIAQRVTVRMPSGGCTCGDCYTSTYTEIESDVTISDNSLCKV